ncbi:MAG: 1-acyl-sn-glycerol-3-phosphate acyltransferase [Armatimonadota bacterium]|nr:1-acyl-sn-glycerol-3-phosphate acyltransferase [Armatimonadota bacterium]
MIYFLVYPFVFTLFRLIARLLGRVQSFGEENVPLTGGLIYCPNHLSDADPPTILVTIPRRAWYIGKEELFQIAGVGWFFRHFQGFPIKRDSADRAALKRAEGLLKRGEALVLFPEGRCAQDGKLQRIQPGAALLAVRANVPIIPVGLEFTNELLPYGTNRPRFSKHPVRVTFGPAIHPRQFSNLSRSQAIEAVTQKLGDELARLTHQPAPIPPPAQTRRTRREKAEQPPEQVLSETTAP